MGVLDAQGAEHAGDNVLFVFAAVVVAYPGAGFQQTGHGQNRQIRTQSGAADLQAISQLFAAQGSVFFDPFQNGALTCR